MLAKHGGRDAPRVEPQGEGEEVRLFRRAELPLGVEHIVEVGPALSEKCGNVQFRFLPTQMDGTRLIYPYKLAEGISADRHGMTIIKNEKILDIIRGEEINESEI